MTSLEYGSWFESELKKWHFSNPTSRYPNFDDFLDNCCFFMTMMFPQRLMANLGNRHGTGLHDYSIEWDNFHRLYLYVAEGLLGRRFNSPRFLSRSPLAIAGIDFEGSRYASSASLSRLNPHFHALWAFHPDDVDGFRKLERGPWYRLKFLPTLHGFPVRFDRFDRSNTKSHGV